MKHIGIHNDRAVTVMFREVPGEPENCLIVYTDSLPEDTKKTTIEILQSADGQAATDFSEAANRAKTINGENLLNTIHVSGSLTKVPSSEVMLTPNAATKVPLSEINKIINEQKPTATTVASVNTPTSTPGAMTDEQLATSLRNQANTLQKEVERLLTEAEELHPLPKRGRGRPPKMDTSEPIAS